jgi:hypothetical protein
VHPFVRFTEYRLPEVPESARYIKSYATSEDQKDLLDVLNAADEVGRPFIMSKQVPAERVAIIRRAFDATMKDKDFLADMEKLQLPAIPVTGEDAEKIVARMMNVSPKIIAQAKAIYE